VIINIQDIYIVITLLFDNECIELISIINITIIIIFRCYQYILVVMSIEVQIFTIVHEVITIEAYRIGFVNPLIFIILSNVCIENTEYIIISIFIFRVYNNNLICSLNRISFEVNSLCRVVSQHQCTNTINTYIDRIASQLAYKLNLVSVIYTCRVRLNTCAIVIKFIISIQVDFYTSCILSLRNLIVFYIISCTNTIDVISIIFIF